MARSLHKVYALFLVLSVFVLIAACSQGPSVPFPAVDFTLEDVFTGDEITLSGLRGRPVLLYFFASW